MFRSSTAAICLLNKHDVARLYRARAEHERTRQQLQVRCGDRAQNKPIVSRHLRLPGAEGLQPEAVLNRLRITAQRAYLLVRHLGLAAQVADARDHFGHGGGLPRSYFPVHYQLMIRLRGGWHLQAEALLSALIAEMQVVRIELRGRLQLFPIVDGQVATPQRD